MQDFLVLCVKPMRSDIETAAFKRNGTRKTAYARQAFEHSHARPVARSAIRSSKSCGSSADDHKIRHRKSSLIASEQLADIQEGGISSHTRSSGIDARAHSCCSQPDHNT